jgi:membrane protein implicated in regulation of membrane protease activity
MFKLELIMTIEMIIGAAVVVLLIAMAVKHRSKPVDMNHKAPNVHNEQMKGKVGPATAAEKPAAKATKKTTKKKTTKKKTTKKTASKKK